MVAQTKRVVWDACSWIALILDERIYDKDGKMTEDRGQACRLVIDEAGRRHIEIVAPAMTLVEVCSRQRVKERKNAQIRAFFDHEYIYCVGLDTEIAEMARELVLQKVPKGLPWLRPVDATYIATAADLNVTEVHTLTLPC